MNQQSVWAMILALALGFCGASSGADGVAEMRGANAIMEELQKAELARGTSAKTASDESTTFTLDADESPPKPSKEAVEFDQLIDRLGSAGNGAGNVPLWVQTYARIEQFSAAHRADPKPNPFAGRERMTRLLRTLPAPETWPALATALRQRYPLAKAGGASDYHIAALALAAILVDDNAALRQVVSAVQPGAHDAPPHSRREVKIDALRQHIAERVGNAELMARFSDKFHNAKSGDRLAVPDLVTALGTKTAEALLRDLLARDIQIVSVAGQDTLKLAQTIAVSQIEKLQRAQWVLVSGAQSAPLYEAMRRRFPESSTTADHPWNPLHWFISIMTERDYGGPDDNQSNEVEQRAAAQQQYFGALLASGRIEEAVALYRRIHDDESTYQFDDTLNQVDRAGHAEPLLRFLEAMLREDNSEILWDRYIELAPRLGRQDDMLARLRAAIAKAPARLETSTRLTALLIKGLLAADSVDEAAKLIRERLADAAYPKPARAQLALTLTQIGRLTAQDAWREQGLAELAAARTATPSLLIAFSDPDAWMKANAGKRVFDNYIDELGKLGRYAQVESLLLTELKARSGASTGPYGMDLSDSRDLLIALVANYSAADRPRDVIALLDRSSLWRAGDLAELLDEHDRANVPLAFHAAQALAATGGKNAALHILEAVIAKNPGYDPAYALYIKLRGLAAAQPFLDAQFAHDPFEERPLLWKAIALKDEGKFAKAEELARKAQAIDPSDGDEGSPDRMRVYAVLADLLQRSGDTSTATIFANAVKAIRIGEQGDELRLAGLHTRAMERYRAALDLFSDAYCVQSRLAVELNKRGNYIEAEAHYRRAYELMPQSFGRLESHCFGCENVFQGDGPQSIAEHVFFELLSKMPKNPKLYYVYGYLHREQGRYADARQLQRVAVDLDPDYLSAWKQLDLLGEQVSMEIVERDEIILRLLALDPAGRHVQPDIEKVHDLRGLYRTLAAGQARHPSLPMALYSLKAAAKTPETANAMQMRAKMAAYGVRFSRHASSPADAVARSAGLQPVRSWLDLDWVTP